MEVLLFAVPIALLISLLAVLAFIYQVKSGQFDDLETPPLRMLFDDVEVEKHRSQDLPSDLLNDVPADSQNDPQGSEIHQNGEDRGETPPRDSSNKNNH